MSLSITKQSECVDFIGFMYFCGIFKGFTCCVASQFSSAMSANDSGWGPSIDKDVATSCRLQSSYKLLLLSLSISPCRLFCISHTHSSIRSTAQLISLSQHSVSEHRATVALTSYSAALMPARFRLALPPASVVHDDCILYRGFGPFYLFQQGA